MNNIPHSVSTPLAQEHYLHDVYASESIAEEERRERLLIDNVFSSEYIALNGLERTWEPRMIEAQFLEDKKTCLKNGGNFGDIFALGISDKYVNKIDLIELQNQNTPDGVYSPDAKRPYKDLRCWLINNGVIERELSREESGRTIVFRRSNVSPEEGSDVQQRIIGTRERPLIRGTMKNESGTDVKFEISKTMVFSITAQMVNILAKRYEWANTDTEMPDNMKDHIENLLHQINDPEHTVIQKIRTGYYLRTELAD